MKKLITLCAVVCAVIFAKAACVDWAVTGAAAQENYTVYLLTSISESYESVEAIAAASVGSAVIAKSGRSYSTGAQNAVGASITKDADFYFAIVSGADATQFNYVSASALANSVYDPDNQESTPGTFSSIKAADILGGTQGTIGQAVPEPTSGLLLLVGMAGLALRRKQK